LVLNSALTNSSAFVAAWLPGTEGQGVADVLFGKARFSGKLPRDWPSLNSPNLADSPLFPFGYGLTY
jgi:beta-glucosidase